MNDVSDNSTEVWPEVKVPPTRDAVFIGASRYRRHSYGSNHPLGIPRVSLTLDLIQAYGAIGADEYRVSRKASVAELEWFHTRDYVSAMQRCEAMGKVLDVYRKRHNIGNFENPYFPDFFVTPAVATGGSIQGAEEVLAGRVAFNPAGGMHHARPDQARGFCFFNDPVLGVMRLRRERLRVLYLDIDAHHGDGVEAAFAGDPEVLTVSLHMDTGYAYPFEGGGIEDRGPHGNAVNLPLPQGTHDAEYRAAFEALWPRVADAFAPDAVVLQAGTDMLLPDPLGKFRISTQLFIEVVERVIETSPGGPRAPRLLVLGGGGYHPLVLARCWTGVWARLSGRVLPEALPAEGAELLRAVDWDFDEEDEDYYGQLFESRIDPPRDGPVRDEVRERIERLVRTHPLLGRL